MRKVMMFSMNKTLTFSLTYTMFKCVRATCVCPILGVPPGPKEELLDEEVPHDALHLAES